MSKFKITTATSLLCLVKLRNSFLGEIWMQPQLNFFILCWSTTNETMPFSWSSQAIFPKWTSWHMSIMRWLFSVQRSLQLSAWEMDFSGRKTLGTGERICSRGTVLSRCHRCCRRENLSNGASGLWWSCQWHACRTGDWIRGSQPERNVKRVELERLSRN